MRNYYRKMRAKGEYEYKAPHGGAQVLTNFEPPAEIAADAERRNTTPHSSLTAELCGDPKPGQSALDKQRS